MAYRMLISVILLTIAGLAHSADNCTALLQNGVRDHMSDLFGSDNFQQMHSAVCEKSEEFAESKEKIDTSGGYGAIWGSFFGSRERRDDYRRFMCSVDDELSLRSRFMQSVRNHTSPILVAGYVECVRLYEGGVDLDIIRGQDGVSLIFDLAFSRNTAPNAALDVFGWTVVPEMHADNIKCSGTLAGATKDKPVKLTQTVGHKVLTCQATGAMLTKDDNDFSIVLETSLGAFSGWLKPHYSGKHSEVAELRAKHDTQVSELQEQIKTANARHDSFTSSIDNRITNLRFANFFNFKSTGVEKWCKTENIGHRFRRQCLSAGHEFCKKKGYVSGAVIGTSLPDGTFGVVCVR